MSRTGRPDEMGNDANDVNLCPRRAQVILRAQSLARRNARFRLLLLLLRKGVLGLQTPFSNRRRLIPLEEQIGKGNEKGRRPLVGFLAIAATRTQKAVTGGL